MRLPIVLITLACGFLLLPGCGSDEDGPKQTSSSSSGIGGSGGSGGSGGTGGTPLVHPDCDPIVPTQCGFPFPSNLWLVDDATTKTAKRVQFGDATLPVMGGKEVHLTPALVTDRDGFSPGQAPMTHLPGATLTGLPTQDTLDVSLSKDSPTIIIEAETGKAVPHFAELDMTGPKDEDRAFMLRPVVRLKDATRYIVAIRGVLDANGDPLEPTSAFKALRDGTEHPEPSVAKRAELYADIMSKLEGAGYETKDLQIAWDYSTASRESNTSWLVHMRDEALQTVGPLGPEYTVTGVEEDPNADIKRRIHGLMKVPLYLDQAEAGGKLVFGADGMPEQNGMAEFEFMVQIPHSATKGTPGALLQNGHGLLGKLTEGKNSYQAQIANSGNFVIFAVNLVGMHADDEAVILKAIIDDFIHFKYVIERQHQGILNSLLAMRMMKGRFVTDPNVQFNGKSAIDPTRCYYRGDSQGGIFGATYMALTTDVERGLLCEPGMPYNLLLNRSVDFEPFLANLKLRYSSYRDLQLVLGLAQLMWDRTDPIGYFPYLSENMLPGTKAHQVLMHVAMGDYQVTPLGAHLMARTVGAKNISPTNREVWGVESTAAPYSGNAMVEFDFGVPELPKTNEPPKGDKFPKDGDPHDKVRVLPAAVDQTTSWLREGVVKQMCDGACDPE